MILPPLHDPGERSAEERELYANLSQCVRCAICLPTCPTFQETLDEGHSPRGRIALVRSLYEKEGTLSSGLNEYLYNCLECRACETACPNNVVFHRIIEYGKERLDSTYVPRAGRFFKGLFLRRIFRHARSLDRFMAFLRFYRRSGLQAFSRFTRILKLLPWHLGDLERLVPATLGPHRPSRKKRDYCLIPAGEVRGTVQFFSGCIADHWLQRANHATLRLLLRAGYAVRVPAAQQCCGALHLHLGESAIGEELARANIAAFATDSQTPLITNAAGCGAALKEYGHLLRRQDDEAAAQAFSSRVLDLSQFLCSVAGHLPTPNRLDARVTWDDPCHLVHGQKVSAEPRRLIKAIPGVTYVELKEASWCCGSAGVYNIVNYGMSMRLLARKLEHVRAAGAEILVTANPGCYLQLRAGVRHEKIGVEVVHLAELLDRQYDGDPQLASDSDAPPWA